MQPEPEAVSMGFMTESFGGTIKDTSARCGERPKLTFREWGTFACVCVTGHALLSSLAC